MEYTQELLNILGDKSDVNPVMNAVCDAFTRRRFSGSFRLGNQGAELDTLLNAATRGPNDDDEKAAGYSGRTPRQGLKPGEKKTQVCYLFQSDSCTWSKCRFWHACSKCQSTGHGLIDCPERARTTRVETRSSRDNTQRSGNSRASVPPHPRTRRSRANN